MLWPSAGCPPDPSFLETKPLSWRLHFSVPFAVTWGHLEQQYIWGYDVFKYCVTCKVKWASGSGLCLYLPHPMARIWIRQQPSLTTQMETPPREMAEPTRRKEPGSLNDFIEQNCPASLYCWAVTWKYFSVSFKPLPFGFFLLQQLNIYNN